MTFRKVPHLMQSSYNSSMFATRLNKSSFPSEWRRFVVAAVAISATAFAFLALTAVFVAAGDDTDSHPTMSVSSAGQNS